MFAQIKQTIDIRDVISQYVLLTRRGSRYSGLCPFHDDHHPSLNVDTRKQNYICYACGAKGDVITFIQQIEKCTFADALQKLKVAPSIPQRGTSSSNRQQSSAPTRQIPADRKCNPVIKKAEDRTIPKPKDEPPKPLPTAGNQQSPFEGLRGLDFLSHLMPYISGDHDLSVASLDFEVGVAPHRLPHPWESMQGRLIFPVRDETGKLVGVAGRKPAGAPDKMPKYLNSPGMPRHSILYGLDRAKDEIRRTGILYLVEGFKDVIAMHAAGFTNTVGLCGTQMANGQKQLIRRYAGRVIVMMDNDEAGRKAATGIIESLSTEKIKTDRIRLPEGSDPDSLFREKGKEAFAAHIRMLSNQAPWEEQWLMAILLLYPALHEASEVNDAWWPEQVAYWIREERLFPELYEHNLLIDHYTGQGADTPLPPELLPTAHYLQEKFSEQVIARCRNIRNKFQTDQEQARRGLVQEAFFSYSEICLCHQIKSLTHSLKGKYPGTTRNRIHRELIRLQKQLSRVSKLCEYAGAVR